MARVNVSLPDELIAAARAEGLNVSRVAAAALATELERIEKVRELDRALDELRAEQGPSTPEEEAEAEAWVDRVLATPPVPRRRSA